MKLIQRILISFVNDYSPNRKVNIVQRDIYKFTILKDKAAKKVSFYFESAEETMGMKLVTFLYHTN